MCEAPGSCTWLCEEVGVYNFYLRTSQAGSVEKAAARDLSAAEAAAGCEIPADGAARGAEAEAAEAAVGIEAEEPVNVKSLRAPWEPTKEEREAHEASGHAQFRSWCRACLAGAGRDTAHTRVDRPDERAVPVMAADYCFMGEKDEGEANARCMPILVIKFDVDKWLH